MDVRVLQYFLAVAREESFTGAAKALQMTQPPLSRSLKDLEEELGKTLFIRGNRRVALTEEGMILRKRAEEIVQLMEMAKAEVTASDEGITGDVHIGGAETEGFRFIGRTIRQMQKDYPGIRFHLFSSHSTVVLERLERGLLDFGIFIEPTDMSKLEYIKLPSQDVWGVLMRKDSPLATHETVRPQDLIGLPLIASNQDLFENELSGWMGGDFGKLNIVTTYNLLFNASLLAEEGVGYVVCLDNIIKTGEGSTLTFRPLEPRMEVGLMLGWKKYEVLSKPAEKFRACMQNSMMRSDDL